ncbi:hypothetical protein [Lacipirellula parvula]|uniref:hypothetical protein n=1 Tax=Lacipirellula parvula TaxID=2650471 RepID=UPI00126134D7|nr:hypothetical protein [Lacipirellula parvula]
MLTLYGALRFARSFPYVAYPCFALFAAIFIAAVLSDMRHQRRMRESQRLLADLVCPACGAAFGISAAEEAFNPLSEPSDMLVDDFLVDDFGCSTVVCGECKTESIFHRLSHKLTRLRGTASDAWAIAGD